jgi:RimJ/RimL family protein N-acetyltransferase
VAGEPEARGGLVSLRKLGADDVGGRYVGWMRDPDVTRHLEARFADSSEPALRRWVEEHGSRADTLLFAIVENATGRHVGNLKVGPLDPHHATADVGLLIGERDCWGRGYGTEAIRLATAAAFERLGARKLTASCYADNAASARAFVAAGWREEGVRPAQFVLDDGRPQDQVLLGILRGETC